MVTCAIRNCSTRSGRDTGIGLYSIPAIIVNQCEKTKLLSEERRRLWLARINRPDLTVNTITKHTKVCSRHFINGIPSKLFEYSSPDWAPSLNLGYDMSKNSVLKNFDIDKSKMKQLEKLKKQDIKNGFVIAPNTGQNQAQSVKRMKKYPSTNQQDPVMILIVNDQPVLLPEWPGIGTQTKITAEDFKKMEEEVLRTRADNMALRTRVNQLEDRVKNLTLNEDAFKGNDEKVKFYTGLPTYASLMEIYNLVSTRMESKIQNSLTNFQQFLIVLIRLRLHLTEKDLAYRFQVSQATISRLIPRWIPIMASHMENMIVWPDRDTLKQSMPDCFKKEFGDRVVIIVNCFEVHTNRLPPFVPKAGSQSQTKVRNTVKYLIAITPQGAVCFISQAWVGQVGQHPDKHITEHCGVLENLEPGDMILTDRGFDSEKSVDFNYAELQPPDVNRGKVELAYDEPEYARKFSKVRNHVKKVIGLVRSRYNILKSVLPLESILIKDGQSEATIDQIIKICCVLSNLAPPILSGKLSQISDSDVAM